MLRDFFGNISPVVKNLLLLNLILFVFIVTGGMNEYGGYERNGWLGLFYIGSPEFKPYQIVSHMFAHGGPGHLIFNMLSLVMFGSMLERIWGSKRFLIFYLITGLGAAFLHEAVHALQVYNATGELFPYLPEGDTISRDLYQPWMNDFNKAKVVVTSYYTPTVGASGAIYGLLIAFAMLFPNTELMFLFFPVPVKAKYIVPFFVLLELYLGIGNFEFDNVAHFAHLGGALFGFIMVKIWQRKRSNFY